MTTNKTVGMLMRKYRREKKMSLQQVADRMHKSKNSISLLELGVTGIEIDVLQKYCNIIGHSMIDLMKEADLIDRENE